MSTDPELWRSLRVGDRVRLIEYPTEFLQPGYYIHPDTVRVYKGLLRRKTPLRVYEIDEYDSPWIACRFRRRNGGYEWHTLRVDHDGLAKVKSRNRRTR